MKNTRAVILALTLCLGGVSQLQAQTAPWVFGFGTGFALLSTEGTAGFHTAVAGPIEAEFDLSPGDVLDLLETAFGFSTFATNGQWMAKLVVTNAKLGDEPSGTLEDGTGVSLDAFFELFQAEFTLGYTAYRSPANKFALRPHVGARYTSHELGVDVTVTGENTTEFQGTIEESWTDFVVGTSVDVSLGERWGWSTVLDAGFGGSEGTYHVASAVSWQFATAWSLSPTVSFFTTDYENGTKGDAGWYLYDVNDSSLGLAIVYMFSR